ncbi:uncharacterized protein SPPG_05441 [Spizellomyces punctatus DAOM BR117]|uniref:Protein Asterix n=1 Tax=Spizellomyces punctatus (strain DAOM BR117) TaxID=645134 RepID=A0A0L0HCB6_SPIPD|nr:uncharacterized protein SPPG_05441 [Spizellomyces punctatus DAOM BR117]KNC99185.1 hypothetical protein SPPG_05441 [Spizellomyces punctatus DAOM BR117]|eukprot:XP_016607225.1 hypothetical protein SPPG_05441 [Spizellomyces punctatus DAOM BR117]
MMSATHTGWTREGIRHGQTEIVRGSSSGGSIHLRVRNPWGDLIGMVGIVAGITGMVLRLRWVSWVALVSSILSVCTSKASESDGRQGASGISFAFMAIIGTYMQMIASGQLGQKENAPAA